LDPDFEDGYALAVACLDMDDGKCAERIFSEMESSFGDKAVIHMEFGRAYAGSDFPGKAVAEFKKAIGENDHLPEAHYSLAAAYLASGETSGVEKARVELEKELRVSPKDFLTYAALGHIAVIQHRYDDAKKYLTKAIALNPSNPDAYLYLGQMYYETRQATQAESALREAIARTTDVSRNRYQIQKAHYLLGRLLIKDGHEAEAQEQMRIVQKMMARTLAGDKGRFSGNAPAKNGMGGAGIAAAEHPESPGEAKDAGAVADFEKQVAAPLADSYNNLGAIAASGKNYAEAVNCFQRAAEWNPKLPGLDYNWGRAAFLGSRFEDAVTPLSRYLAAHPEDANIRPPLAISLFMTRDYGGVVKTLTPILSRVDAVPQVEYVYAASLVKTGQRATGMARLLEMEKKNPSIPDVHRSLGEAYAEGGAADREKAAQEFEAAIRLNPKDAEAHLGLGKLELQTGDGKKAVAELATAVRLEPDNAEARSELAAASGRNPGAAENPPRNPETGAAAPRP
ncbi:MAG: tetratricopeptide repeat protein, partial [Acidobacteriaceae bacterium]